MIIPIAQTNKIADATKVEGHAWCLRESGVGFMTRIAGVGAEPLVDTGSAFSPSLGHAGLSGHRRLAGDHANSPQETWWFKKSARFV